MNKGLFLHCIAIAAVAGAFSIDADAKNQQVSRPNIIVIMCDDMGYSDIASYGGEIQTPNLDNLAAKGLRFTQFYNTARCCPSRASLLTGLYAHQAGVGRMVGQTNRKGYEGHLTDRGVTIAELLRAQGYQTRMVGKWHVSPHDGDKNVATHPESLPLQRGFEQYWGTIAGAGSFYYPKGLMRGNQIYEVEDPDSFYYTDAISDKAAQNVRECTKSGTPFFMYVAYTAPHWPLHALPEDIEKYAARYRQGWDVLRNERYARMIELGIIDPKWPLSPRSRDAIPWEDADNKEWEIRRMAVYAAMIDRMDQGIGRIVAALEETGALENTLILFLSDNGGCKESVNGKSGSSGLAQTRGLAQGWDMRSGNHPGLMPGPKETFQSYGPGWANASDTPFRRFKKWGHEGGIATPLIAHWPAIIKNGGGLTAQMGHIIDILPTCLEAAGAAYPKNYKGKKILPVEGKSLVPIFKTGTRKGHDQIAWEHIGNRAIRRGKWKLVAERNQPWELYDMQADRTELNNLAETRSDIANELEAAWEDWAKRTYVK